MGWISTNKRSRETLLEFFTRRWYPDPERCRRRIVALAQVGLTEAYLAVEDLDTRAVSAVACQIMFNPEPGYNFGYRDSSEESGPVRRNCPARILDLLTPTSSKYAQEWRADCRERIEARRYASTLCEAPRCASATRSPSRSAGST